MNDQNYSMSVIFFGTLLVLGFVGVLGLFFAGLCGIVWLIYTVIFGFEWTFHVPIIIFLGTLTYILLMYGFSNLSKKGKHDERNEN